MKTKFAAILTLKVVYEIDQDECLESNTDPAAVKKALLAELADLPDRVSSEGMLTYDLPATVAERYQHIEVQ